MKKRMVLKFAGISAIPVYILFTFVSHLFNMKINPSENWLSDYGNPLINPDGAFFYNLGCIITAILLAAFYAGMKDWYAIGNTARKYKICFVCAQVFGFASSVLLILTSLFPLGTHESIHGAFSMLHMISMDCFISFTALAILMRPDISNIFGIFGCIAVIFNILTTNMLSNFYIAEWIYFLMFIVYIVVLTIKYDVFGQGTIKSRHPKAATPCTPKKGF